MQIPSVTPRPKISNLTTHATILKKHDTKYRAHKQTSTHNSREPYTCTVRFDAEEKKRRINTRARTPTQDRVNAHQRHQRFSFLRIAHLMRRTNARTHTRTRESGHIHTKGINNSVTSALRVFEESDDDPMTSCTEQNASQKRSQSTREHSRSGRARECLCRRQCIFVHLCLHSRLI